MTLGLAVGLANNAERGKIIETFRRFILQKYTKSLIEGPENKLNYIYN